MSMGTAQKSTLIKELVKDLQDKRAVNKWEVTVSGIDRATPEELLPLTN